MEDQVRPQYFGTDAKIDQPRGIALDPNKREESSKHMAFDVFRLIFQNSDASLLASPIGRVIYNAHFDPGFIIASHLEFDWQYLMNLLTRFWLNCSFYSFS